MITAGIDVGSISTKAVIIEGGRILSAVVIGSGYNARRAGQEALDLALKEAGLQADRIVGIVATGYGRNSVDFAHRTVTEITCHGLGAHFLDPAVRSVIDIGGQDSKAMALNEQGRVREFVMNDKCAAGTGRFLEVMARALEVDLEAFGRLSLKADRPAPISSVCTVFAESEVISLIAAGEKRENIIAGIHAAVAARVTAMARRIALAPPTMMTGGVAKNIGVVKALEERLGHPLHVSEMAQLTGAIGAALIMASSSS
jgi:predicted CoA-substrate-specific enzyme activase